MWIEVQATQSQHLATRACRSRKTLIAKKKQRVLPSARLVFTKCKSRRKVTVKMGSLKESQQLLQHLCSLQRLLASPKCRFRKGATVRRTRSPPLLLVSIECRLWMAAIVRRRRSAHRRPLRLCRALPQRQRFAQLLRQFPLRTWTETLGCIVLHC